VKRISALRFKRFRALLWCFAVSLLFHFVGVPLIVALFGYRGAPPVPLERIYVARSSAVRFAPRAKPQTPRRLQAQQRAQAQRQPARRMPRSIAAVPRAVPALPVPETKKASLFSHVRVPKVSEQTAFEQQQASFEQTIARLRREQNPLISNARPVQTPAAPKRYDFDFAGTFGHISAEGVLTPVKSWHDGPYDYYYVAYRVQYADGGTETGYVPWPLRYLPSEDPFLLHWERFPLPAPLPDFQLPPGTTLHPLVAFCFEHRNELSDCPIQHD